MYSFIFFLMTVTLRLQYDRFSVLCFLCEREFRWSRPWHHHGGRKSVPFALCLCWVKCLCPHIKGISDILMILLKKKHKKRLADLQYCLEKLITIGTQQPETSLSTTKVLTAIQAAFSDSRPLIQEDHIQCCAIGAGSSQKERYRVSDFTDCSFRGMVLLPSFRGGHVEWLCLAF